MPSIPFLIKKLKSDFPAFNFQLDDKFLWSSDKQTIYYTDNSFLDDSCFLIHELAHALLDHSNYNQDIELLAMERNAWDKALEIAPKYGLTIDNEFIQSNLDTYRDWLHKRSTCPNCAAIGMQTNRNQYSCIICQHNWTVNEARTCALRRYNKK